MKKAVTKFTCVCYLLICSYANAQVLLELSNDTLLAYSYSGGDEFNEKAIDNARWDTRIWPGTNVRQYFAYESDNAKIENGLAIFSVTKNDSVYRLNEYQTDREFFKRIKIDTASKEFRIRYAAGSIVSRKKLHYGIYELRFKIENGKGTWPAFWFYGGYKNEELDVFELKGEKADKIHVDVHCPVGCDPVGRNWIGIKKNWGGWLPLSEGLDEGFNIVTLSWRPDGVTWEMNGFLLAEYKGRFPNPMNLYINTQVASDYSAFQPGPDESTLLPNHFFVDYLRIWTLDSSGSVLKPATGYDISNQFKSDYTNRPKKKRGTMYDKSAFQSDRGLISILLLPSHQLKVTVLGAISDQSNGLTFKGEFGTYRFPSNVQEALISIDPREQELLALILSGEKELRYKLILKR